MLPRVWELLEEEAAVVLRVGRPSFLRQAAASCRLSPPRSRAAGSGI